MSDSGTLGPCPLCGQRFDQFGVMTPHRFVVEDVGEICPACARSTVPDQVRAAEALDRQLADDEGP